MITWVNKQLAQLFTTGKWLSTVFLAVCAISACWSRLWRGHKSCPPHDLADLAASQAFGWRAITHLWKGTNAPPPWPVKLFCCSTLRNCMPTTWPSTRFTFALAEGGLSEAEFAA